MWTWPTLVIILSPHFFCSSLMFTHSQVRVRSTSEHWTIPEIEQLIHKCLLANSWHKQLFIWGDAARDDI